MEITILKDSVLFMRLNIVSLFVLLILMASCKQKIAEVCINNDVISSNKVVLDDTLLLKVLSGSQKYSTLLLSAGKHSFTLNGGQKENFEVTEEGGILNLGKQEFVIFPITYSNTTAEDANHSIVSMNYPILVNDSLVVYDKNMVNSQAKLIELLQKDNVKDFLSRDLIKIPASQLFISRSWDFGLDQDPSDSISVKVKTKDTKTHGFRSKITDAKSFLLYTWLSDKYTIERVENKQQLEEILKKSE